MNDEVHVVDLGEMCRGRVDSQIEAGMLDAESINTHVEDCLAHVSNWWEFDPFSIFVEATCVADNKDWQDLLSCTRRRMATVEGADDPELVRPCAKVMGWSRSRSPETAPPKEGELHWIRMEAGCLQKTAETRLRDGEDNYRIRIGCIEESDNTEQVRACLVERGLPDPLAQ